MQIHGPDSFQLAKRKARYGHRDWLCWEDVDGSHAAPKTAANVEAMLSAIGTEGKWFLLLANDGCLMKGYWELGLNLLAQMRVNHAA